VSENGHAPGVYDHPRLSAVLERLKESRVEAGLTQAQVCALLGLSGNTMISAIERGDQRLAVGMFLNLCDAYGASPVWVLTGSNPNFDPKPFVELLGADNPNLDRILRTLTMMNGATEKREAAE